MQIFFRTPLNPPKGVEPFSDPICSKRQVAQQISPQPKKWFLLPNSGIGSEEVGGEWKSRTSSASLGPLPCWSSWLPSPSSSWHQPSPRSFQTLGLTFPRTKKPSQTSLLDLWIFSVLAWGPALKHDWANWKPWSQTSTTPSSLSVWSSLWSSWLACSSSTFSGRTSFRGSSTSKESNWTMLPTFNWFLILTFVWIFVSFWRLELQW